MSQPTNPLRHRWPTGNKTLQTCESSPAGPVVDSA
jgi:hypothetical protein